MYIYLYYYINIIKGQYIKSHSLTSLPVDGSFGLEMKGNRNLHRKPVIKFAKKEVYLDFVNKYPKV